MTPDRQALFVLPPRASSIGRYSTSTSVATADLRLIGVQTADVSQADRAVVGAVDVYVTVQASGSDCWVAFGATSAAVGSIDATTAAVNAATGAVLLPAGVSRDYRLEHGVDTFIGYITAAGTGLLTVHISSPR